MTFQKYLTDYGLKDAEMAARFIPPISRCYVTLLRLGLRRPSLSMAQRIEEATKGEVPVSSWPTNGAAA